MNTSSNAIKKAFISNSKIKLVKPGDIILFYASHDKKAITALGIVDTTWNKFETIQEIIDIVKKRTAYNEFELKSVSNLDSLVILFKHYLTFKNPITYDWLLKQNIIKGMIQGPVHIEVESLKRIIEEGKAESMVEFL